MTYEQASLSIDRLIEARIPLERAKHDLLGIMIAYGSARASEATQDAIRIFNPRAINAVEDRIEDGMQEAREMAYPHPKDNPEAYEEWNKRVGHLL